MHSRRGDNCPTCDVQLHGATEDAPYAWCPGCETGWLGVPLGQPVAAVPVFA